MSQFNLNREWIFEHESNYQVLHPGDVVRVDRPQEGRTVPGTIARDVAGARVDYEGWIVDGKRSCVPKRS